jgi:multiple sugar transport system permease protein
MTDSKHSEAPDGVIGPSSGGLGRSRSWPSANLGWQALRRRQRGSGRRDSFYRVLFVLPAIVVLLLLGLYPFLFQVAISFTDYRLGYPDAPFVGLDNFAAVLADERFYHSIGVWLQFTVIAVAVEIAAGLVMSLCLNSVARRHRRFILPILIIPLVLSPVVMGSLFRMMLSSEFGVLIYLLDAVGLHVSNPLASSVWVVPTLALVDAWQWAPFVCLITFAGLQGIPQQIIEAARVDGASPLNLIWRISLPLIRTEILIAFLFLIFRCLKAFDTIFAMTGGGPSISSEVFNLYLYHKAFDYLETSQAAVMGLLVFVAGVILTTRFVRVLYQEGAGKDK